MRKALSLDIGGTKIYAAQIDTNGEIVSEIEKHPTPKTAQEIVVLLRDIISRFEDEIELVAI